MPIFAEHVPPQLTGINDHGARAAAAARDARRPAVRARWAIAGAMALEGDTLLPRAGVPRSTRSTPPAPATCFAAASSTRSCTACRSTRRCASPTPPPRSAARGSARSTACRRSTKSASCITADLATGESRRPPSGSLRWSTWPLACGGARRPTRHVCPQRFVCRSARRSRRRRRAPAARAATGTRAGREAAALRVLVDGTATPAHHAGAGRGGRRVSRLAGHARGGAPPR